MSAIGYSTSWLEQRYAIDANSRNESITDLFIENLPTKRAIQLLDLGAGIGSNVKYFSDKISENQHWYCVEIDTQLIKSGLGHLSKHFESLGYSVGINEQFLTAKKDFTIKITYIENSLLDIISSQFLAFDGILGNALLDVFTGQQISNLFEKLQVSNAPKLFSIIYENMVWGDDDPQNDFFVHKYHQHMQREQAVGNALGPGTIEYISSNITFSSGQVILSESNWHLDRDHSILLKHLIEFYQNSIPELLNLEEDLNKFNNWVESKIALVDENNLDAIVRHSDMLCLSS